MNAAIILSGGIGSRLGADVPKQYLKVNNKTILSYCVESFSKNSNIDIIVIVRDSIWDKLVKEELNVDKPILFAEAGITRQLSIYNGLKILDRNFGPTLDKVIIQDAARPLTSSMLIDSCLEECNDVFTGVMPVLPMKDTIYESNNGYEVDKLLDRSIVYAGQAPEVFKFNLYLHAHKKLDKRQLLNINGSSELAFIAGMRIKMIPGDPFNFKITDRSDLSRFKEIINKK